MFLNCRITLILILILYVNFAIISIFINNLSLEKFDVAFSELMIQEHN